MDLQGKRAVVTGASRGIGAAVAERLARAGARVAVVARSVGPLQELADRLGGSAYPADLTDRAELRGLVDRIEADGGPVDLLVNNAGVDATADFTMQTADDVEALYRLNLVAPVELCRQVLPGMLARGRGHIVNVSSLAGVGAFPGFATYGSSKAGLSHFTAGLRADLRGTAVRTTLVELGPVPTDMLSDAKAYEPTGRSFRRMYRLRVLVDVPAEQVAGAVVDAVLGGRRHVRLPRRAAALAMLAEAPRRATEWVLTGVPHQPRR
jgi:short-subunit dehydrogenase